MDELDYDYADDGFSDDEECTAGASRDASRAFDASCIRAEREDDDGYDPYSDRVEVPPLFERDPWA